MVIEIPSAIEFLRSLIGLIIKDSTADINFCE